MSHEYLNKVRHRHTATVDLNAAASTAIAVPIVVPTDAYRWGFIPQAAVDVITDNFIVALDFRPTFGSDTGRVEVQRMTFTPTQDLVAGTVYFADIILPVAQAVGDDSLEPSFPGLPRSLIDVGPAGPHQASLGGQYVIEVIDAAGNAGTGVFFVEVVEHDGVGARFAPVVNKTA